MCDLGDLPGGTYDVLITTTYGYPSYDEGMNQLEFEYTVSLSKVLCERRSQFMRI